MYKKDDAVSPVIGVILMVAITVILAAVIAAFVFGMAGNVQKTKNVAAVAEQNSTNFLIVTFHGGKDAADVEYLNVTFKDAATPIIKEEPTVGVSIPSTSAIGTPEKDHVVATAQFKDGSTQVILDTYV
jgi:flagellin-like protein